MRPKPVQLYLTHVFGPKLRCFKDWCKEKYSKDFQLHQFMFTPYGEYTKWNKEMLEKVATVQHPYGASHSTLMTSGVIWLLRFFASAACAVHLPRNEIYIVTEQNTFITDAGTAEKEIPSKVAGLREKSERELKANKERKKILNPWEEEKKREV